MISNGGGGLEDWQRSMASRNVNLRNKIIKERKIISWDREDTLIVIAEKISYSQKFRI